MTTADPRSRAVHDAAVVVDTHNDLLSAVVARPVRSWPGFFRDQWLPQLRRGGVDVQVLPAWVDATVHPEAALRALLRMVEAGHQIAHGNPDTVQLCGNGVEIDDALQAGRIALVLAVEGCAPIESHVELLHTLFRLGVRIVSLAHFGRTALADGSAEDATGSRLTRAGVEAVAIMNELGILLDVSHLGAGGLEHALEISRRPVIATHSSARALFDHHRNLTDTQLSAIARSGGVVCVNFYAGFLDAADHSLDRLIDHFAHIVSVIGADHVGIGPDFIAEVEADIRPGWCQGVNEEGLDTRLSIPGLEGPAGLPLVTEALLARGFGEDDVVQMVGANVCRLFREHLGVPGTRTHR